MKINMSYEFQRIVMNANFVPYNEISATKTSVEY